MFELDNRPKCTDSQQAVAEWLKTNQPTQLDGFNGTKPRPKHKTLPYDKRTINQAYHVLRHLDKYKRMAANTFSKYCNHEPEQKLLVKQYLKAHHNITLKSKVIENKVGIFNLYYGAENE